MSKSFIVTEERDKEISFPDVVGWCCRKHSDTNHFYDGYIPYRFHLEMTYSVAKEFEYLLDNSVDYRSGKKEYKAGVESSVTLREICLFATWGHDLIEDTRTSYNDIKNKMGKGPADIIYAVSNEKGRNRSERANEKYYEGIRNTPGAVFVKLCDRIANVKYSRLVEGNRVNSMLSMYRKENDSFIESLGCNENHTLYPMTEYLIHLLNS